MQQNNIFIIGGSQTGKSTLAKYIANELSYIHIEASEYFRNNFKYTTGNFVEEISKFSKNILEKNPEFNVNYLCSKYDFSGCMYNVVVSGCRNPIDIKGLSDSHDIFIILKKNNFQEKGMDLDIKNIIFPSKNILEYQFDNFVNEKQVLDDIKKLLY